MISMRERMGSHFFAISDVNLIEQDELCRGQLEKIIL